MNTPPSSPGRNGSVQLPGRASGLIGIVDMFGFESSQVCHSATIEVAIDPSKTTSLCKSSVEYQ